MPRVPVVSGPSITSGVQPSAGFRSPLSVQDATLPGRMLQDAGRATLNAGGQLGQIALAEQQEANAARVTEAENALMEHELDLTFGQDGWSNQRGRAALERDSGQPLAMEYGQKYNDKISELTAGLANDRQRELFRQRAQQRSVRFGESLARHTDREFQAYSVSQYDGSTQLLLQQGAAYWNEPVRMEESAQMIRANVAQKGRLLGKSALEIEAESAGLVSSMHKMAVQTALEQGNAAYAGQYLDRYGSSMTGADALTMRGKVSDEMESMNAVGFANAFLSGAVADAADAPMQAMIDITLHTESGNRRYGKDGNLLTSSAGAKGEMQVLDGTNLDPGFGVTPARDNSPDERARVGRDYLNAMMERYNNDPAKAWAAYNAGPGRLDKALKQGGNWLANMPGETQNYVAKNMSALQARTSTPPQPTEAAILTSAMASPAFQQASPAMQEKMLAALKPRAAMLEKQAKEQQEGALAETFAALEQNGGDYMSLPATLRNALSPDMRSKAMTYGSKIAKGTPVETDLGLYGKLWSEPELLTNTNLEAHKGSLAPSDYKALVKRQTDLRDGRKDPKSVLGDKARIDIYLNELGLDPKEKEGLEAYRAYDTAVAEWQATNGKEPDSKTKDEIAARLFTKYDRKGWFASDRAGYKLTNDDVLVVPDTDRSAIIAGIEARGQQASEENIQMVYRAMQGL